MSTHKSSCSVSEGLGTSEAKIRELARVIVTNDVPLANITRILKKWHRKYEDIRQEYPNVDGFVICANALLYSVRVEETHKYIMATS